MPHGKKLQVRQYGSRVPFQPIVEHPRRQEIDDRLFRQQLPAQTVYRWLQDVDPDVAVPFSYTMLWRYYKSHHRDAMSDLIIANAQQAMRRNYEVLDTVIQRFMETVQNGTTPSPKDSLTAIKLQYDLIEKYGGVPGVNEIEETARKHLMTFAGLVESILNDEQKAQLVGLIKENEDLLEWVLPESRGDE